MKFEGPVANGKFAAGPLLNNKTMDSPTSIKAKIHPQGVDFRFGGENESVFELQQNA